MRSRPKPPSGRLPGGRGRGGSRATTEALDAAAARGSGRAEHIALGTSSTLSAQRAGHRQTAP